MSKAMSKVALVFVVCGQVLKWQPMLICSTSEVGNLYDESKGRLQAARRAFTCSMVNIWARFT